jgi:hypothetical protein
VVLQFASADVLVEEDRFGGEDLEHALVYGVFASRRCTSIGLPAGRRSTSMTW